MQLHYLAAVDSWDRQADTVPLHRPGRIPAAAISSKWWGVGVGVTSGIQGQSPWSGGQRGILPPEAEKKLNFDNTNTFNSSPK